MELRGATALLTGASRGIGPHIARALAREGVHLALAARTLPPLEALAAELRGLGVRSVALEADLSRAEACAPLVDRAEAALGPLDLLVNNAGLESVGDFATLPPAVLIETVAVNVAAPLLLARAAVPGMLARRRGHVVTLASLAGKVGVAGEAVYCGTKAALVEWTGALRAELRGTGVSLSAICPGYVTGEGMFAVFGLAAPRLSGSSTPGAVAAAVVAAVRGDRPEVIVNSTPVRPLLALRALSPRLGSWLLDALGVTAFQRRKVGRRPPARPPR